MIIGLRFRVRQEGRGGSVSAVARERVAVDGQTGDNPVQ
jgi:hypothetical protein